MVKKKPTEEEDGKLVKEEPKEEEKAKKEVIKADSEKEACNDGKVKKAEDEDEEEEEEEDELEGKKKKAKKGVQASINPQESEVASNTDGHTLTPGLDVPSKPQDVFVPTSSVDVSRESTPMGKSASPDLLKSPLFIQITKQMDSMQDALTRKVDALQKSVEDRMKNIKSDMEKIEKFYNGSFYKAASDEVGPEGLVAQSFSKQLEEGSVRFRNK